MTNQRLWRRGSLLVVTMLLSGFVTNKSSAQSTPPQVAKGAYPPNFEQACRLSRMFMSNEIRKVLSDAEWSALQRGEYTQRVIDPASTNYLYLFKADGLELVYFPASDIKVWRATVSAWRLPVEMRARQYYLSYLTIEPSQRDDDELTVECDTSDFRVVFDNDKVTLIEATLQI